MKKIYGLILCCCFSIQLLAQYNTYEQVGNLTNQRMLETDDGGYLLMAIEFCYSPDAIPIEGCVYGIHLVKTDEKGDTLWTTEIAHNGQFGPHFQAFQNSDGTYTIFAITNNTFTCNGIGIGLFGLRQVKILNISANGDVLSNVAFPDDCELTLVDAMRIADNKFLVVSYFEDPIMAWGVYEGRITVIDGAGTILQQKNFFGERFASGHLIPYGPDDYLLAYLNSSDQLTFDHYDSQLNQLSSTTNSTLSDLCFDQVEKLQDGNIALYCKPIHNIGSTVVIGKYDPMAQQLWEKIYSLPESGGFVEEANGNFLLVSSEVTNDTLFDIKLTSLSATGDSLFSEVIALPGQQKPRHIWLNAAGEVAITGNHNCCNYQPVIGPARTFLLLPDGIVTSDHNISNDFSTVLSPNPVEQYLQIQIPESYAPSTSESDWRFSIYSILGKQKKSFRLSGSQNTLDLGDLIPGTYLYTISTKNKVQTQGKIVKVEGR